MERKLIYAFRGWIAFVAFMDLGTAGRSYIEKRSFLSKTISDVEKYVDEEYTTSRIVGIYSILKALILIHCTLYIHYRPDLPPAEDAFYFHVKGAFLQYIIYKTAYQIKPNVPTAEDFGWHVKFYQR